MECYYVNQNAQNTYSPLPTQKEKKKNSLYNMKTSVHNIYYSFLAYMEYIFNMVQNMTFKKNMLTINGIVIIYELNNKSKISTILPNKNRINK